MVDGNAHRLTSELTTEHLALREMDRSDLPFVAEMLGDREVMRYFPKVCTEQESRAWIARQQGRYERDGYGYWLVTERETGQPVGQAGLMLLEVEGTLEPSLGYMIHRPFWRRGLATEAARASLDHGFDTVGHRRLITLIRPENEPSLGVARKLGMRPEGETRYSGYEHRILFLERS